MRKHTCEIECQCCIDYGHAKAAEIHRKTLKELLKTLQNVKTYRGLEKVKNSIQAKLEGRILRPCKYCGNDISHRSPNALHCSDRCKDKTRSLRVK